MKAKDDVSPGGGHSMRESLVSGYTGHMFIILTITFIVIKITQRILPPLLPAIIVDLGITTFLAGIALSLLRITRAGMQYPGGRISDRLTRTTVLVPSLIFVLAGLGLLAVTNGYPLFLLGIFFFGMGLGLFDPAARAMLTDLFVEKRGRAFGIHLMGGDLAGVLAAGIAILITAIATWRGAFLPVLLLLLPAPLLIIYLSHEKIEFSRINFGIRKTGIRLVTNTKMRRITFVYMLFVFSIGGVVGFLPTFLTEVHDFSFALASSVFALLYVVGTLAKPIAGTASDRFPRLPVVSVALLCGAGGLAMLTFASTNVVVIAGVIVYAIGHTSVPPPLQAYLMDLFPNDNIGGDFGAVRSTYLAAGSLGPAYVGLMAGTLGFVAAFSSIIVLFTTACLLLIWIDKRS